MAPRAIRELTESLAQLRLGVVDALCHGGVHDVGAVLPHDVVQPCRGDVVRRDHRADVQRHQRRHPGPAEKRVLHVGLELAVADQPDGRYGHAFGEDVVSVDAEAPSVHTADVDGVQGGPGPGEQRPVDEDRAKDGDVVLVRGSHPRVVEEEHVALADARAVAAVLQGPADHLLQCCRVDPEVVADREEIASGVAECGVEVVRLVDYHRAGDLPNGRADLVVELDELVRDDLVGDGVKVAGDRFVERNVVGDVELAGVLVDDFEALGTGYGEVGHGTAPGVGGIRTR